MRYSTTKFFSNKIQSFNSLFTTTSFLIAETSRHCSFKTFFFLKKPFVLMLFSFLTLHMVPLDGTRIAKHTDMKTSMYPFDQIIYKFDALLMFIQPKWKFVPS